jgi:erythrin-vacuolar iron transport family protein
MNNFSDLSEQELLALAISLEEEDSRIYGEFAHELDEHYPDTAKLFRAMGHEESGHRHRLLNLYRTRFGEHIPLIRREDVKGFVKRKPVWMSRPLGLDKIRELAEVMEAETKRFYSQAALRSQDTSIRQLLGDLAAEERRHEAQAERLEAKYVPHEIREKEHEAERRLFVLQIVQPGLAGLMDGSVSTLAPLFAAAFATQQNWPTFLIGLASAIGAGISMGFAEALSDDGSLTGRGGPWLRGVVCGLMTALGGLGHTLPYLVPDTIPDHFRIATTIAGVVVFFELWAIAFVRARYMDTPFLQAVFQIVLGGAIVLGAGVLIGGA